MSLQTLRRQIDLLDRQVTRLLKKRMTLAKRVGKVKEKLDLPVYAPGRHREVIRNVLRENRGVIAEDLLREIYRGIMWATRTQQFNSRAKKPPKRSPTHRRNRKL